MTRRLVDRPRCSYVNWQGPRPWRCRHDLPCPNHDLGSEPTEAAHGAQTNPCFEPKWRGLNRGLPPGKPIVIYRRKP